MQPYEPTQVITVVLFAALPEGTSPLRLDAEQRRLKDALERSGRREQFRILVEPAVTVRHIRRVLLEHKPQIVQFCGHGTGAGGIVCEDDLGQVKLIPTDALANLFKLVSSFVKCVILNCCFSDVQANEIAKHIDYVIGMNSAIGDKAASSFSEGFFDAFFAEEKISECFKWGVNAIQLESIPEDLTPVLRMRVAQKKTRERRPKKLSELVISSIEEKPVALTRLLSGPMPKRAFLGLLISGFLYAILVSARNVYATFISPRKEYDFAGTYIQEKNVNDRNKPCYIISKEGVETESKIRRDMMSTTVTIFFNRTEGTWRAIETSFWKYYYVPDPRYLETRYFIGASRADFDHKQENVGGSKLLMKGEPTPAQIGLKEENLLGKCSEQIAEIQETVKGVMRYIEVNYKQSVSE